MKFITFILAFLFPCFLFGQNLNVAKADKYDLIEIAKTWKTLLQCIHEQDRQKFKSISLGKIVCNRCRYWDNHDIYADISKVAKLAVDSFINEAFYIFEKDGFWKMLENDSYSLSVDKVSNNLVYKIAFGFQPANMPEGFVHYIIFLKVGNRFKFYGVDTIP